MNNAIIKKIAIITIMFTPPAREQIHKDPYLIVIDCFAIATN